MYAIMSQNGAGGALPMALRQSLDDAVQRLDLAVDEALSGLVAHGTRAIVARIDGPGLPVVRLVGPKSGRLIGQYWLVNVTDVG